MKQSALFIILIAALHMPTIAADQPHETIIEVHTSELLPECRAVRERNQRRDFTQGDLLITIDFTNGLPPETLSETIQHLYFHIGNQHSQAITNSPQLAQAIQSVERNLNTRYVYANTPCETIDFIITSVKNLSPINPRDARISAGIILLNDPNAVHTFSTRAAPTNEINPHRQQIVFHIRQLLEEIYVDFVVTPEYSLTDARHPIAFTCSRPAANCEIVSENPVVDTIREVQELAKEHATTIFLGTVYEETRIQGETFYYNSMIVIGPEGRIDYIIRKASLDWLSRPSPSGYVYLACEPNYRTTLVPWFRSRERIICDAAQQEVLASKRLVFVNGIPIIPLVCNERESRIVHRAYARSRAKVILSTECGSSPNNLRIMSQLAQSNAPDSSWYDEELLGGATNFDRLIRSRAVQADAHFIASNCFEHMSGAVPLDFQSPIAYRVVPGTYIHVELHR